MNTKPTEWECGKCSQRHNNKYDAEMCCTEDTLFSSKILLNGTPKKATTNEEDYRTYTNGWYYFHGNLQEALKEFFECFGFEFVDVKLAKKEAKRIFGEELIT